MAKGGKRTGAGRPAGSTNVPRFTDYVTEEDRAQFAEFMMSTYMGDMNVAKWVGDHLFRKPPTEVTGEDGQPIAITYDRAFAPRTTKDSQ